MGRMGGSVTASLRVAILSRCSILAPGGYGEQTSFTELQRLGLHLAAVPTTCPEEGEPVVIAFEGLWRQPPAILTG